ncbi:hypothetical protein VMCG_01753 [Cytospora schulzeri]|uniref:Clr5 domain-containing protein n=1 Tax=Cytospora schulzeri TaxID=448051 RepID=A0A423X2U4_9PEZI|nr:hypothetical protein VMCG_01753 [Valsa malicola]
MPPTGVSPAPPAGTNPWSQNEHLIRRLYQDERKTLEQVKQIMETKHNFPKNPLSTWETKLRDVLGLRKRLKKNDWPIVYRHVAPRRAQKKETAVYLNGTQMDWRRAWKEMRRCGITAQPAQAAQVPLPPLPPGVDVRTPSPVQFLSANDAPSVGLSHTSAQVDATPCPTASVLSQCISTCTQPTSLQKFVSIPEVRMYADSVYRLCLESTPFINFVELLARTNSGPAHGWQWPLVLSRDHNYSDLGQHSSVVDSFGGLGLAVSMSCLGLTLIPTSRRATPLEVSTNFDIHYHFVKAVYVLSNGLTGNFGDEDFWDFFEVIFGRDPRTVLATFQRKYSPSLRAAWERLVRRMPNNFGIDRRRNLFRNLMELGIYNHWIDSPGMGHTYLYYAVCMDCVDIVRLLLSQGCRLDTDTVDWTERESAIVSAVKNRNLECTRLLIEHCDVNREILGTRMPGPPSTNFCIFIDAFRYDSELHLQVLKLFLENNADVDAQYSVPYFQYGNEEYDFWRENDTPKEWRLSILEYCFYRSRPLFKLLKPYSKTNSSQLTRAGILDSLEHGLHSLRDYLKGVRPVDPGVEECLLQLILAEQFLIKSSYCENVAMDPHVALILLELGVDPTFPLMKHPPNVACGVAQHIDFAEDNEARQLWMSVLQLSIRKGASLDAEALESVALSRNTNFLQYVTSCTASIADKGSKALAIAASMDNLEAVKLLLGAGVDINSYVHDEKEHLTILAFAVSRRHGPWYGRTMTNRCRVSYRMMKYLVENGARLVALPDDWHPCHFLRFLLRSTPACSEVVRKAQYIVENFINFRHPSTPSEGLLEACLWGTMDLCSDESQERLELFEYLSQKGLEGVPGSSLAPLIVRGGRQQLVQKLIHAGADIHAYSFSGPTGKYYRMPCAMSPLQAAAFTGQEHLVQQLLKLGARVDVKPLPEGAVTAFQCICQWDPVTPEENMRKLNIIQILIDHGAEVNESPSGLTIFTGLQEAAFQGSLDIATLLLRHGANINDPSIDGGYALDIAVGLGRMDMVQLLLNANAVSSRPGKTGYDGAIERARERGHFALAELVFQHAENNSKWGIVNSLVSLRHEQHREDSEYNSKSVEEDRHGSGVLFVSHYPIERPDRAYRSSLSAYDFKSNVSKAGDLKNLKLSSMTARMEGDTPAAGSLGKSTHRLATPAGESVDADYTNPEDKALEGGPASARRHGEAEGEERFEVATGAIVESQDIDKSVQYLVHPTIDTIDGGLVPWLFKTKMKDRTQVPARLHVEPPSQAVSAFCECGRVQLRIFRPQDIFTTGGAQYPYSPYPDLMYPSKTTPRSTVDNPLNERWYLRHDDTKYLAGTCACRSCRLSTGYEIQTWAFIPRAAIHISLTSRAPSSPFFNDYNPPAPDSYIPLDFEELKRQAENPLRTYESSPGVFREFCPGCGATVFWHAKIRPDLIDVSVGLLHASEGARAETLLEWWRGRCSFAEDAGLDRTGWLKGWAEGLIQELEQGMNTQV